MDSLHTCQQLSDIMFRSLRPRLVTTWPITPQTNLIKNERINDETADFVIYRWHHADVISIRQKTAAPEQENVSPLNELSTTALLFTVKCLDICEDLLPKEVFLPTLRLLFTFSVNQKDSLSISLSSKCISSCRAKSLSWPRSPFTSGVTQGSNSSVCQNCWLVFWLNHLTVPFITPVMTTRRNETMKRRIRTS